MAVGRAAASLAVKVDADTKQATQQLSLFDKRLKKTSASATAMTKDLDAQGKQLDATTGQLKDVTSATKDTGTEFDRTSKTIRKTDTDVKRSRDGFSKFGADIVSLNQGLSLMSKSMALIKWPAMVAGVGYAAEGLSAAAGGAVALTSALAPLAGLASAGGAALATMGQVQAVIALSGIKEVTEAVGGLNEALDKTADEYKQLSPEGQKFARTLNQMKQPLQDMQKEVQKPLFTGLTKGIQEARGSLPELEKVLTGTAEALGEIGERVGKFLGSDQFGKDLTKIGEANNKVLGRMGSVAVNVGKAFMDIQVAARPLVDWISRLVQNWAKALSQFTETERRSGGLTRFFQQTKDVTQDLVAMFTNMATALWNIGKAGAPLGREILDKLRVGARHIREFTESTSGKNQIAQYFEDIRDPIMEAGKLLRDVALAILDISQQSKKGSLAPILREIRKDLLPVLVDVIKQTQRAFGPKLVDLVFEVARAFGHLGATNGPLMVWVETMTRITSGFNWLLDHVPGLSTVISTLLGFKAVGSAMSWMFGHTGIKGLINGLKWFVAAETITGLASSSRVLTSLAVSLGLVEVSATGLTWSIRALVSATVIGAFITAAILIATHWEETKKVLEEVWNFIQDNAGKLAIAFAALTAGVSLIAYVIGKNWDKVKLVFEWIKNAAVDAAHAIVDAFEWVKTAVGNVVDWVGNAIKDVWEFLKSLPGRIKDAFIAAGRWIINAVKNWWEFFKSIPERIRNAVSRVPGLVRDALVGLYHIMVAGLQKAWEFIRSLPGKIWNVISRVPGLIKDALVGLYHLVVRGFQAAWDFVKSLPGRIWGAIKKVPGKIKNALVGLFGIIIEPFKDAFEWIKNAVETVFDKIEDLKEALESAVGGGDDGTGLSLKSLLGGPSQLAQDFGETVGGGARGGYVFPAGVTEGFARGGTVGKKPQKKGKSDTVPAFLTPGEIVLSVAQVKALKDQAEKATGFKGDPLRGKHGKQLVAETKKTSQAIGKELQSGYGKQEKAGDEHRNKQLKTWKEVGKGIETGLKGGQDRALQHTAQFRAKQEKSFQGMGAKVRQATSNLSKDTTHNFDQMRSKSVASSEKLHSKVVKNFADTKTITGRHVREIQRETSRQFDSANQRATKASGSMQKGVSANFDRLSAGVNEGLGLVETALNKALKSMGLKPVSFSAGETKEKGKGKKAQRGAAIGRAVGGVGTGDKVHAMLEPGEVVVNRRAVAAMGGPQRVDRINSIVPRFATGGWVDPAGPGTGVVNPQIADVVGAWSTKYNAAINYGYDPGGGHVSPGHNVTGTATDTGPAGGWAGQSLQLFEQGLKVAVAAGLEVGYGTAGIGEVWPGHGRFDHAHIEWGMNPSLKGIKGAAPFEQLPQVELKGPPGSMTELGQATITKVRNAANQYLSKKAPMGADSPSSLITGDGDVAKIFAQVARRLSTSNKASLALFEAGVTESGMRDLTGGDSTSTGSLQLLASTASNLGIDPHDEGQVSSHFLLKGYWGKGGANQLAEQNPSWSAGNVAQNVQGSAYPERYDQNESAARAIARSQGLKLQGGGIVRLQGGGEAGRNGGKKGGGGKPSQEEIASVISGLETEEGAGPTAGTWEHAPIGLDLSIGKNLGGETPRLPIPHWVDVMGGSQEDKTGAMIAMVNTIGPRAGRMGKIGEHYTKYLDYEEFAARASNLDYETTDANGDSKTIWGLVGGLPAVGMQGQDGWLNREWGELVAIRNRTLNAITLVDSLTKYIDARIKQLDKQQRTVDKAYAKLKDKTIPKLETKIENLQERIAELQKIKKPTNEQQDRLHSAQRRLGHLLFALEGAKGMLGYRKRQQQGIPKLRGAMVARSGALAGLSEELKTSGGSGWGSGSDGFPGLSDVQGRGSSMEPMENIDVLGTLGMFGGLLGDLQAELAGAWREAPVTPPGVEALEPADVMGIQDLIAFSQAVQYGAFKKQPYGTGILGLSDRGFAGAFALGGRVPAGMWGIAGEAGPEVVQGPAMVYSNSDSRGMADVKVEVVFASEAMSWLDQFMEVKVNGVLQQRDRRMDGIMRAR